MIGRVAEAVGRDAAQRWWELSDETHRVAFGRDPTRLLQSLDEAALGEPASPLAPAYRLWAADALSRVSRDREALAAFDGVLAAADSAPPFDGIDFVGEALRRRAAAQSRLGDHQGSVATARELAARGELDELYQAAAILERAGRRDAATQLYRELAKQASEAGGEELADRAARGAQRLETEDGVFTPSPLAIAKSVEDAVLSRDAAELRRLVSRTHFQVGPGAGHLQFEDEEVVEWLCADLARSRPQPLHRGLRGSGDKRYLLTSGWRGRRFKYVVGFVFGLSGRGWAWEGVLVTAPADPWLDRWTPAVPATNQALDLRLLAPWPEGRHFTAGGLSDFIWACAVLNGLRAVPFVGWALAAARAYQLSLATCGFGLRGFYYNAGPTHTGDNAFAIDFSSYRRGRPFVNASGGTPVLSAADGTVRSTWENEPSGGTGGINLVEINHTDQGSLKVRYVTRYLHLAGPKLLLVSPGMAAPRGLRLGLMNDTGDKCVIDHLHFSVHDSWAASHPGDIGPSVRPSPMDGQVLGDDDSGVCLRSTNRETQPLGWGAVVDLLRRLLDR